MAIIPDKDIKNTKEGDEVNLKFTNGDLTKLREAMQEWSFKDVQSLLRFTISCLKNSEDKRTIGYVKDKTLKIFSPAEELLMQKDDSDVKE